MIYSLTPNPALDVSGHVDALVPNEKNYVHDEQRDPGGNGINSARIIHRIGAPVTALGWLGGTAGSAIARKLRDEGVRQRFIPIRAESRTNITVFNHAKNQQTRLTFPGPEISNAEQSRLYAQLKRLKGPGILLLGGSLPRGVPSDFYGRVSRIAESRGIGVILDAPAPVIRRTLAAGVRPLFLKPNHTELEEWAGRRLSSQTATLEAARRLARKAAIVCISLGSKGALLICGPITLHGIAPRIRARGTVGAGDSMVGALAMSLERHGLTQAAEVATLAQVDPDGLENALSEALRWGMAAGAATAEVSGTSLGRASEIRRLYRRVKVR